jgi:hypothetical protein
MVLAEKEGKKVYKKAIRNLMASLFKSIIYKIKNLLV